MAEAAQAAAAGAPAAADRLLAGLDAPSHLLREAAARGVARVAHARGGVWPGPPQAGAAVVDRLLQVMADADRGGARRDSCCRVRTDCVAALGELRPPAARVEATLRRAASTVQIEVVGFGPEDTAVPLRANAALVMAQLRCDCLPDLALLLFDGLPDPVTHVDPLRMVRESAARSLALLGDPAGAALLAVRLRERGESGEVRAACIDALCTLEHPRAAEWIGPLLDADDPAVSVTAASALCALCPDEAVPALVLRIAGASEMVAEAMCLALGSARCTRTVPALRGLLEDRRPAVRAAAAQALGILHEA